MEDLICNEIGVDLSCFGQKLVGRWTTFRTLLIILRWWLKWRWDLHYWKWQFTWLLLYVFITLTVPRHCYVVIINLIVDLSSLPGLYCFATLLRRDNVLDCWYVFIPLTVLFHCWYVFITQTVPRHCHTAIWHSLHSRLFSRCSRFIGKLEIRPDNPLFPLLINVLLINSLFALGYFWRWIIYPPRRLFCFIISFLLSYLFLPVQ